MNNQKVTSNLWFTFAANEDLAAIILLIPKVNERHWNIEYISKNKNETFSIDIEESSNSLTQILAELQKAKNITANHETLVLIYDSFILADPPLNTAIIDLKVIVEWLYPGHANYELSTVLKSLCSAEEQSLQAVLSAIYKKLSEENELESITRACLSRIQHDIAFFLIWLINNAAEFNLVNSDSIDLPQNLFPENPDHLQRIIQQLFWANEAKNTLSESKEVQPDDKSGDSIFSPIDIDHISSLFNDIGRFSAFPGYQPRQTQIDYARQVGLGLNDCSISLIEAGTGTGKTMGYCLPAMQLLVRNPEQKVLIATTTKNLQSQLFFKDIPAVRALDSEFEGLAAALLKGKANYYCLQALLHEFYRDFIAQKGTAEDQLLWLYFFRLLTVPWSDLESVTTGISLSFPHMSDIVARINSADHCYPDSCSFSPCMYEAILSKANQAQLIVTNHHLLFYIDNYLSKRWDMLIVDESEELPSAALSCFSNMVNSVDLDEWCDKFLHGRNTISLYQAFTRFLPNTVNTTSGPESTDLMQIANKVSGSIFSHLVQIKEYLSNHQESEDYLDDFLSYNQNIKASIQELNASLFSLIGIVKSAKSLFPVNLPKSLLSRWNNWVRDGEVLSINLGACIQEMDSKYHCVTFLAAANQKWQIECRPLYTDYHIHNSILENRRSIIFTSASLSLEEEGLQFIKEALGIQHYRGEVLEKQIPSPPKYYDNAVGLIYRGMRYPEFVEASDQYEEYLSELSEILEFLVSSAKGKTLVLFTNANRLKRVYSRLEQNLKAQNILPLIQNGASLAEIELFKKSPAAALFGLNRFWRGVDIAGKALQQLIIVQLPRSFHLSPFWKKRQVIDSEKMERYYRNQSYFNFRQMVGRLIRKADDSGLIVLLDSRPAAHSFILNTPITMDKWRYVDKKEQIQQFITSYIR